MVQGSPRRSQSRDGDAHGVRERICVLVPCSRQELLRADDTACRRDEDLEDGELLPGQRDVAAVTVDLAPERVHPQTRDLSHRRPRVGAPAVERSEAEHELSELERLREVVVGAELESDGLVVEAVGGGEHEDRHAAAGGDDALGDLVAGGPRDVPVEDGDVVGVEAQQLQGGVAVTGDVCRDRLQAQAVADGFRHVGLVLDEQHTHAPMLEPAHIAGISKTGYAPATPRSLQWGHGLTPRSTSDCPAGSNPQDPCVRPLVVVAAIVLALGWRCHRRPRPRRRPHRFTSAPKRRLPRSATLARRAVGRSARRVAPSRRRDGLRRPSCRRLPTSHPPSSAPSSGRRPMPRRTALRIVNDRQRLALNGVPETSSSAKPCRPTGPPRRRRDGSRLRRRPRTSQAKPWTLAPQPPRSVAQRARRSATGSARFIGNEAWHYELRPEAGDRGCPPMYADAAHDPRMSGVGDPARGDGKESSIGSAEMQDEHALDERRSSREHVSFLVFSASLRTDR